MSRSEARDTDVARQDAGSGAPDAARHDVPDIVNILLEHTVTLLPVAAAGVMLDDGDGPMRLVASSGDEQLTRLLDLQSTGGPGLLAFASRQDVLVPDLAQLRERWPRFVEAALARGVQAAHAFPLGSHAGTLGSLTVLLRSAHHLDLRDRMTAGALTDLAAMAITNHDAAAHQDELTHQLQGALDSRVLIEQAKGVLAAQQGVGVDAAFDLLRNAARASHRSLTDLAQDVVEGRVTPARWRQPGPGRPST